MLCILKQQNQETINETVFKVVAYKKIPSGLTIYPIKLFNVRTFLPEKKKKDNRLALQ